MILMWCCWDVLKGVLLAVGVADVVLEGGFLCLLLCLGCDCGGERVPGGVGGLLGFKCCWWAWLLAGSRSAYRCACCSSREVLCACRVESAVRKKCSVRVVDVEASVVEGPRSVE